MASREFKSRVFYYDRWDTFKEDLYRKLNQKHLYSGEKYPKYIFRGQANYTWKPQASFFRSIKRFGRQGINANETDKIYQLMLERFDKQLKEDKEYRHLFSNDKKDIDTEKLEQLARHYELPSKLTDWSESPYIAAFFAFSKFLAEDSFSKSNPHSGSRKFVGVWALKMNKKKDKNEKKEAETSTPKDKRVEIVEGDTLLGSNPRLRGQRGWFVRTEKDLDLEKCVTCTTHEVDGLTLFAISAEKKQVLHALEDLDLMGITYASLYTGITGYVEHAKMRMQMKLLDPPK